MLQTSSGLECVEGSSTKNKEKRAKESFARREREEKGYVIVLESKNSYSVH